MLATEDKRFYWIKLREDFFDDEVIDYIMSLKNGPVYICLYQILCLKSSNQNGMLVFTLRDRKIPYDVEKIRREAKYFDVDTIMVALDIFKSVGLIEVVEDGAMFLPRMPKMVGSEAANAHALRQKRYMERKKLQQENQLALNAQDNTTQSVINSDADDVTQNVTKNDEEYKSIEYKSIEIRDKSIENINIHIQEGTNFNDENLSQEKNNYKDFSFDTFKKLYPRESNNDQALEVWSSLNPSEETARAIFDSISDNLRYNENWKKKDGYYIPSPQNFLDRPWDIGTAAKVWDQAKWFISQSVTKTVYKTWYDNTTGLAMTGSDFVIRCQDNSQLTFLRGAVGQIQRALGSATGLKLYPLFYIEEN